jgi:hypothetical protein
MHVPPAELNYLAMVIGVFAVFAVALAYYSWKAGD